MGVHCYMKLRDRLRSDKGSFYNWPPIWTNTREDPTDKPRGEIGNLQEVLMTPEAADDILFIAIDIRAVDTWAQWDFIAPRSVVGFTFFCSRMSVFRLRRSATSNYLKSNRTGAGTV